MKATIEDIGSHVRIVLRTETEQEIVLLEQEFGGDRPTRTDIQGWSLDYFQRTINEHAIWIHLSKEETR